MSNQDYVSFRRKKTIFKNPNDELELSIYPFAKIKRDDIDEAMIYCQENFQDEWIWSSPIQTEISKIWFLHQEDALLFKLRFNTI